MIPLRKRPMFRKPLVLILRRSLSGHSIANMVEGLFGLSIKDCTFRPHQLDPRRATASLTIFMGHNRFYDILATVS
jgi:hypothetical protein